MSNEQSSKMNDQTYAIYAAADDSYVPTAVMALRSFQRWYPDYGYFLGEQ